MKRSALGGFVDSLVGTSQFLWDFLGGPDATPAPPEPPHPQSSPPKPDGKIPPIVIDTEGEDV